MPYRTYTTGVVCCQQLQLFDELQQWFYDWNMDFGKRLKKLREPLTQKKFAEKVSALAEKDGFDSISQQMISKLEGCEKPPKSAYYHYICEVLGITQSDLLQGHEVKRYQTRSENEALIELVKKKLGGDDTEKFAKDLQKLLKKNL